MKNNSLQVKKESIFTKFVNFIKKSFGKKTVDTSDSKGKTATVTNNYKPNFLEQFKVNQEAPQLLILQNQYEKGEIGLCVMSNEEIHELNSLYQRQVTDLKTRLNNKKAELSKLQYKLKKQS